jgi:hypothetical protein
MDVSLKVITSHRIKWISLPNIWKKYFQITNVKSHSFSCRNWHRSREQLGRTGSTVMSWLCTHSIKPPSLVLYPPQGHVQNNSTDHWKPYEISWNLTIIEPIFISICTSWFGDNIVNLYGIRGLETILWICLYFVVWRQYCEFVFVLRGLETILWICIEFLIREQTFKILVWFSKVVPDKRYLN